MLGQHLDGNGAVQAGVGGFVDLTHAARAERGFDLVWAELSSRLNRHGSGRLPAGLQQHASGKFIRPRMSRNRGS